MHTGKGEEKRNVCGADCPCVPLLVTPGATAPARAAAAPWPLRVGTAAEISRGGDRSRSPVCGGNTHAHIQPRHHNLNPSPTLRELQVTDHVGLTPARAGRRSGSAPAPSPGFAGSGSEQRQAAQERGVEQGGRKGGEEEKLTLRLPRPLPPAPPASPPPATPPHAFSPAPSPLHSRSPAAPGGIFLVASFSFTFSFSSISEHSERRELGGGARGEPEREWGKS